MNGKCRFVLAVAVILAMTATGASAAYPDGFEDYAVGTGIIGQGTWIGWEGIGTDDAFVTDDEAHTGDKSLELGGVEMVDLVPEFAGVTSGVWEYSAWTLIPLNTTGGFDMGGLSKHGPGVTQWFGHIGFSFGDGTNGTIGSQSINYDTWAEVKSVMDVDAKTFTISYDGIESGSGAWGGDNAVVGVDVWTRAGTGTVYIDDVNLVFVPKMVWQGGPGSWANHNWDDGTADQPPTAGAETIINADTGDSVVTVATDFTTISTTGPAKSVFVGEEYAAKLTVASGVTLEVTDETTAGEFGKIAVENGATLQTGSAVIEPDGHLISGVQGSAGDCGLLQATGQLALEEFDDGGTLYGGPEAIQVDWLPLPPDPVHPEVAAASMFGGTYTVAKYTGTALATAGKTTNPDADVNIGEGYIKSVAYAVDLIGDGSVLGVQVTIEAQGLGDTDLDADVDGDDLATFGLAWSPSGTDKTWFDGDFDFDGDIDGDDLAALGLAWAPGGITFPAGDIQVTTVPEPGTIVMLLIGMAGLLIYRKRR